MNGRPYDLILPIKKKWYDMILSGEKKEEYRTLNRYYRSRLFNILGLDAFKSIHFYAMESKPFRVLFRNGYSNNSPSFIAKVTVRIDVGLLEWGAEYGVEYYVFNILEISPYDGNEK